MKSWELKSGIKVYQILSGRSNAYLIQTETQIFLVDTGKSNKRNQISQRLTELGILQFDWLLLTHTHFDHCKNANWLKQKYNCKIAVSNAAQNYIKQGFTPLPKGNNLMTSLIENIGNLFAGKRIIYEPFTADLWVKSEYFFKIENHTLRIIATPGHSSDSVSILIDDELALVGDSLFGVLPNSIKPPYADDFNQLKKQWRKLYESGCQIFLPGHGKAINVDLLKSKL